MALDFAALKEKLRASREKSSGSGGSIFWRPEEGKQTVRIVEPPNGDPFVDFHLHYGVGNNPGFICPKRTHDKPCAVCEFATQLYREGTEESIEQAKRLFAKQRFFSPVLVRGEEDKKIRWWGYSRTVYETLLELCLNPDYSSLTDSKNGFDLLLEYGKAQGKRFPETKITPRRKESPLCKDMTEEDCNVLLDSIPDLAGTMHRKTSEEIEELLTKAFLDESDAEEVSKETEKYGGGDNTVEEDEIEKAFKENLE